jgi:hypothetical protein
MYPVNLTAKEEKKKTNRKYKNKVCDYTSKRYCSNAKFFIKSSDHFYKTHLSCAIYAQCEIITCYYYGMDEWIKCF